MQDFRSKNGLYSSQASLKRSHSDAFNASPVKENAHPPHPSNIKAKDLFNANLWKDDSSTSEFYRFISSLRQSIHKEASSTTAAHRFIRTLRDRQKLVRCYTQNIDGLEEQMDLSTDLERGQGYRYRFSKKVLQKPRSFASSAPGGERDGGCEVVQLHGDLGSLRCTLCQKVIEWDSKRHSSALLKGKAPRCPSCTETDDVRQALGKRGTRVGTLRPNIVLYGEEHPSADAIGKITTHDLTLYPDLLLILGTSLHVHGLKTMVREFAKAVHARPGGKGKVVFVNLTRPAESVWKDVIDYWVCMDCDAWVEKTKECRPEIWKIQKQLSPSVKKCNSSPPSSKKGKQWLDDEADKENIQVILDSETSLTSSPPATPKVVVATPKKHKPEDQLQYRVSPLKTSLPNRRVKTREIPDSDPQSSLPTPPSSGDNTPRSTRKRKALTETYEECLLTPSKRRRVVEVWED
ncbi:uncharacterized protein KY384_008757 [Bacidia gigantensis]|uniref:uncharacterized protein n=1 Tax=Bacidia gigantensis TaxID=2732470 RepID=UPI001D0512FB|nr:uncharacterized protein KY384_008757 [Bacidia gigantensis]KAG8526556.1 hypothetical protein KY384_008757 [Bacidia gigantensis]